MKQKKTGLRIRRIIVLLAVFTVVFLFLGIVVQESFAVRLTLALSFVIASANFPQALKNWGVSASDTKIDSPSFTIQFVDLDSREHQTNSLEIVQRVAVLPSVKLDSKYHYEVADYLIEQSRLVCAELVIINTSSFLGENVRMEIVYTDEYLKLLSPSYKPKRPSNYIPLNTPPKHYGVGGYRFGFSERGKTKYAHVFLDKIRPQDLIYSPDFQIDVYRSGTTTLVVKLFGDNIPEPIQQSLTIDVLIEEQELSVLAIVDLASEFDQIDEKQEIEDKRKLYGSGYVY